MMVDFEIINQIKEIRISSLVRDDHFMESLVLKGGNAISMGYGLSERASYDLDFSMEHDFVEEIRVVETKLKKLLSEGFFENGLVTFDIKLNAKPKILRSEVQESWGGDYLEFKLISK